MPERKPRSEKLKQPSSIWDIVDNEKYLSRKLSSALFTPLRDLHLDGYTHWPSPYNFEGEIKVLACERTWQARIKMWGLTTVWWFYMNVVPSPVELTRKFLLGGYKCGFYVPIRIKSPLTIFIGEDGVTFLAEVARPFTRFLFYWWAASSLFSALDTWHTVRLLEDECQQQGWTMLAATGGAGIVIDGSTVGGGWQIVEDDFGRNRGGGSAAIDHSAWTADMFCTFIPNKRVVTVHFEIQVNGVTVASTTIESTGELGEMHAAVSASGSSVGVGTVRAHASYDFHDSSAAIALLQFQRFTATGIPL